MGVMQSGINQLIGSVAMAARLGPGFETNQELAKLRRRDAVIDQQVAVLNKPDSARTGNVSFSDLTTVESEKNRLVKEREEVASETFKLNPTEASFEALKDARAAVNQREAGQRAAMRNQQRAQQRAQQQLEQQQRFDNFRNTFTEGGRYK